MDVKVSVSNEFTLPGESLLTLIQELSNRFGSKGALDLIASSDLFFFKEDLEAKDAAVMLMPDCECEGCKEVKEEIKRQLRQGKRDNLDTEKILDLIRKHQH